MNRALLVLALMCLGSSVAPAQTPGSYLVGVVSESGDMVTWLRPGAAGTLTLDRVVKIDPRPPEIDGPHNITTAP
ncbi:MAG: hypothetical protein ABIZ70_09860, partial [Gemmatimonadales bacterium]